MKGYQLITNLYVLCENKVPNFYFLTELYTRKKDNYKKLTSKNSVHTVFQETLKRIKNIT